VWGNVKRKACSRPHPSVGALKSAMEKEYANMSEDFIKNTCSAFRPRVEAILAAQGGHFEK